MTTKSVVVLDYGSGNLRSAQRALERVGADVEVTADADAAAAADGLVVPGVGAFEACMTGLRAIGGEKIIAERVAGGPPGARRLRRHADPVRPRRGVRRRVAGLRPVARRRRPTGCPGDPAHGLERRRRRRRAASLFKGLDADTRFYFVHSYAAQTWEGDPAALLTWATHHVPFLAAVEDGPLAATQFHPEKSGDAGATLLANWVEGL